MNKSGASWPTVEEDSATYAVVVYSRSARPRLVYRAMSLATFSAFLFPLNERNDAEKEAANDSAWINALGSGNAMVEGMLFERLRSYVCEMESESQRCKSGSER